MKTQTKAAITAFEVARQFMITLTGDSEVHECAVVIPVDAHTYKAGFENMAYRGYLTRFKIGPKQIQINVHVILLVEHNDAPGSKVCGIIATDHVTDQVLAVMILDPNGVCLDEFEVKPSDVGYDVMSEFSAIVSPLQMELA